MIKKLSPVVLFTYNRLEHTKQVIEFLKKDKLAKETVLIINSDGARNKEDIKKVEDVRKYIKTITGFKAIEIRESENNKGVDVSVIDVVTDIISIYGKIIVLEDDHLVSHYFLTFMNEALDKYRNVEKLAGISGYCPNIPEILKLDNDCFISVRGSSWGWATWEKQWKDIDWNVSNYNEYKTNKKMIKDFSIGGNDMPDMLFNAMEVESTPYWDIRRCFDMFIKGKYFLYPKYSLVKNIGCDGSGEHCGLSSKFDTNLPIYLDEIKLPNCLVFDLNIQEMLARKYSNNIHKKNLTLITKKLKIYNFLKELKSNFK